MGKQVISLKEKIIVMKRNPNMRNSTNGELGKDETYQREINKRLVKKNMDLQDELEELQRAYERNQIIQEEEQNALLRKMEELNAKEGETPLLRSLHNIQ